MPSNECAICKKLDNNLTIQCDGCKSYLHVTCTQIDTDDAKRITRQRAKGVKFFCVSCNKVVDQFAELKLMLTSIDARLTKLESLSAPPSSGTESFETIVREVKDRIQRDSNIMVFGFSENDKAVDVVNINKLIKSIKPDTCEIQPHDIMRVGTKTSNKSRPIRIVFPSPFLVMEILKNKRNLRSSTHFKNIFIKKDETTYQRNLFTSCRESLKSRKENGEENLRIVYKNGVPEIVAVEEPAEN